MLQNRGASLTRTTASIVCLLVCVIVASPVRYHWVDGVKDSWPLSWYPMFRNPRPDKETVTHMVARDSEGVIHWLPYQRWARGGFNQGRNQLVRIVELGPERAREVCEEVALGLLDDPLPGGETAVDVVVLLSVFNRDAWFLEGERVPEENKIAAICPVPQAAP